MLIFIKNLRTIVAAFLFAGPLIHVQAYSSEAEVLQKLNLIVNTQSQEFLNKHAETIFKTIINLLGHNIDLKERTTEDLQSSNKKPQKNTEKFLQLLKECLSKKMNPNVIYTDGTGMTPLHHAALLGLPDIVKQLLNHNADYQVKDKEGRVALWYADPATHSEELKYLEPKYSLIIPFVGTAMAYSAYKYWLDHQLCYELLIKAENKNWKPVIDLSDLNEIKKDVYSDGKKLSILSA